MAYLESDLALHSLAAPRRTIGELLLSLGGAAGESLRKRWIYHRTLSELEGYSERTLLDFGATRGIDEFARRAAGL